MRYSNWLAQLCGMSMPKDLYLCLGRASTKTTNFLVERLQEAVYDCPGAPFAWVSDTYANLHKNVLPSLQEGFRLHGWEPDIHYVIDREPPKEWKGKMYNILHSWKGTMTFFNGFNLTFISLDRPSIGAGRSYVGVFGDEVKYFNEARISNLLKAVRGYRAMYGESPFYRSKSFTTDMPDPNRIGEHDWILKMAKLNNKADIVTLIQASFIYNECKREYAIALAGDDKKRIKNAHRNMLNWEERWMKMRKRTSFFFIASSFINVDILGIDWFQDEFEVEMEGMLSSVLSIIPKLSAATRFYSKLSDKHFYSDGTNIKYLESLPYGEEPDCRVLKHLDSKKFLEGGLDVGNALWFLVGQQKGNQYRVLKEMFTLPPNYIRELADEFLTFFQPHPVKHLKLYYDRAANNYKKVKQDVASQFKAAIEYDADGKRTGWTVTLMSQGQGNIGSNTEYNFMMVMMEESNAALPKLLIDRTYCPYLKIQLEDTPAKTGTTERTRSFVVKDKKGDKLPVHRLPKESTNFTDAFKYLMVRQAFLARLKSSRTPGGILSPKS